MSSEKAPSVKEPSVKELYFSYFIGRCNPPHQGHFHMINGAITAARENSGKALILLGSGPKAKFGIDRRTEKDPLIFNLKKEIIENNINCVNDESVKDEKQEVELESVILEESNYEIVEMTNPTAQVIEFVETELQSQLSNNNEDTLIKITVEHFCGEKELEDEHKMRFYRVIQEKLIEKITNVENNYYYNVEINTDIKKGNVPNEAGVSMSATEIRTTAFNSKKNFEYYSCLYGEDTTKVYDAIIKGKEIGEKTLLEKQNNTESKTRKKKDNSTDSKTKKKKENRKCVQSEGAKIKKCGKKSGGKLKTNKRKTNKRKTSKRRKTNKRKISRRKRRKTKRTNKRKNDLNK